MAELPAKEGAARPPVGQIGIHLAVEGRGVVVVANVCQLMDHHVFNGGLWVRPAAMWSEIVDRDGYRGPRFIPEDGQ